MVLPLDAMLTTVVAPKLRAEGFDRKGRRFSIANDLGDQALIEVSTSGKLALGDGYRHFWVRPWLVPEPFADLRRFRGASGTIDMVDGLPLWEVAPPPPFSSRWGDRTWALKADGHTQVAVCGHAVAAALVPSMVSLLRRLLDRETLIEEVRRADVVPLPGPDATPLQLRGSGQGREVLPLLADAGETAAVAALLGIGHVSWLSAREQGNPYATTLIDWATERLALRGAPDLREFL